MPLPLPLVEPSLSPLQPATPVVAVPSTVPDPAAANPADCSDPAASCEEEIAAAPEPRLLPDASCSLSGDHSPQGTTHVAPVTATREGRGRLLSYQVEVEDGLAIDDACFASLVAEILNDPRGWGGDGSVSFQQVSAEPDFRLILASPKTTDRLCYPLRTAGKYSCRSRTGVILNLMRWEEGTEEYAGNLDTYREYLVNHEVGHLLGHGHVGCPGPGEAAPVMMQETKGLDECLLNGWPTADER